MLIKIFLHSVQQLDVISRGTKVEFNYSRLLSSVWNGDRETGQTATRKAAWPLPLCDNHLDSRSRSHDVSETIFRCNAVSYIDSQTQPIQHF